MGIAMMFSIENEKWRRKMATNLFEGTFASRRMIRKRFHFDDDHPFFIIVREMCCTRVCIELALKRTWII